MDFCRPHNRTGRTFAPLQPKRSTGYSVPRSERKGLSLLGGTNLAGVTVNQSKDVLDVISYHLLLRKGR